jgi:eukaryotic-like serine/threonine-protein kinase
VSSYENLAQAFTGLNRIEEARATFNTGFQHKLPADTYHVGLAKLDWCEGKDADMEKELESAAAVPNGELKVLDFRFILAGSRGQLRQAREFARQEEDALDRLHLKGRAEVDAALASVEALAGNHAAANGDADEALRRSRIPSVMGSVAEALAILGQDQQAFALADGIQRAHPNDTMAVNVTIPIIRAIGALRPADSGKADPAKAIDSINTAALYDRGDPAVFFVRGLAYEQAGRYAEAQQDLQQVVDMKSHHYPNVLFAVAQLELGRLYQKQGNAPKARIAYQNFLADWKDADHDLPLLQEARTEYANCSKSMERRATSPAE